MLVTVGLQSSRTPRRVSNACDIGVYFWLFAANFLFQLRPAD